MESGQVGAVIGLVSIVAAIGGAAIHAAFTAGKIRREPSEKNRMTTRYVLRKVRGRVPSFFAKRNKDEHTPRHGSD